MELGTLSPRIEVEIVKENMFIHSLWPFKIKIPHSIKLLMHKEELSMNECLSKEATKLSLLSKLS